MPPAYQTGALTDELIPLDMCVSRDVELGAWTAGALVATRAFLALTAARTGLEIPIPVRGTDSLHPCSSAHTSQDRPGYL